MNRWGGHETADERHYGAPPRKGCLPQIVELIGVFALAAASLVAVLS